MLYNIVGRCKDKRIVSMDWPPLLFYHKTNMNVAEKVNDSRNSMTKDLIIKKKLTSYMK